MRLDKTPTRFSSVINWFFSSSWPSALLVFGFSLSTQLDKLRIFPRRWLEPDPSWELDSIAISLVETGQFANPYMIQTGPTAHLPPIYPWLVSLFYRVFGLSSDGGFARGIFLILTFSTLYALLPFFGKQFGLGRPVGLLAGLLGIWITEWAGHGEFLTAIGLGFVLLMFSRRWQDHQTTWYGTTFLGIMIGILIHIQPAVLPVVIGCLVFEFYWSKYHQKGLQVILIILTVILASLPWVWRNYQVFGEWTFIRSNFGLELRMGNHEGAVPTMEEMDQIGEHQHPRTHLQDALLLREIGEAKYMRQARDEALEWIRSNPGDFIKLSLQRIVAVWFGLPFKLKETIRTSTITLLAIIGLTSRITQLSLPQKAVLIIPFITYPAIYYFMAYMPRYRIPINWLIYLLASAGSLEIIKLSLRITKWKNQSI
jgi:hypothetical protein